MQTFRKDDQLTNTMKSFMVEKLRTSKVKMRERMSDILWPPAWHGRHTRTCDLRVWRTIARDEMRWNIMTLIYLMWAKLVKVNVHSELMNSKVKGRSLHDKLSHQLSLKKRKVENGISRIWISQRLRDTLMTSPVTCFHSRRWTLHEIIKTHSHNVTSKNVTSTSHKIKPANESPIETIVTYLAEVLITVPRWIST